MGLLLAAFLCSMTQAQDARLTVRSFDAAEGLAHGRVRRIVTDSRGFVWFCTEDGLSRFDGTRFVTYGKADGLESPVSDILEDQARGTYWIGTGAGLARLATDRPVAAGRIFQKVPLPIDGSIRRLLLDASGKVWIASSEGLALLEGAGSEERVRRVLPEDPAGAGETVLALLVDPAGGIWAGTQGDGLIRIPESGVPSHRFPAETRGLHFIRDLLFGPDGRIWCSFFGGVSRLHADPENRADPVAEVFDRSRGIPSTDMSALLAGSQGEILAGSSAGIARLTRDGHGSWRVDKTFTMRDGLTTDLINALGVDPAGNLLVGTVSRGVMRLLREGFRRYPEVEESASLVVGMTGDGSDGMLVLAAIAQERYRLHHLTVAGVTSIDVKLPPGLTYLGWGYPRLVRARDGGYWVTTGDGLLYYGAGRASGPARLSSPPDRRFGPGDGLPGRDIFWAREDSRGTLWVAVSQPIPGLGSVARREPGADRFTPFPETIGAGPRDLAVSFAEGPDGSAWVSFWSGRVVRIDPDGSITPLVFDPPFLDPKPFNIACDARGWLWVFSAEGPFFCAEPLAPIARLHPGHAALAGAGVRCVVEDAFERLYFGTDRGVFRVEDARGSAQIFTHADGLAGDSIYECARDARGGLWFRDMSGVARLTPTAESEAPPIAARIAALRIDGEASPIVPLGAASFGPVELQSGSHRVAAEFFAITHTPGARVLFQHRFEGGADWSTPSDARTLEFPRLAPGRHRLLVRALPEHGPAATPVVLELRIPAPIWQRAWFLLLCAAVVVAGASAAYRLRVARLLALERMRTRIATDLHDAVGADLSRISLLADFVRRDVDEQPARARTMLAEVARTARDAVREMSDIVWALKSTPGDLSQVLGRVRDYAADVAGAAGISLRVHAYLDSEAVLLTAEDRRELYLLLKEAVHNAIRHAAPRTLELEVRPFRRGIAAELRDDGCGFHPDSPTPARGGHGLASMRERAARLGGTVSIESAPGHGTRIRLELPRT